MYIYDCVYLCLLDKYCTLYFSIFHEYVFLVAPHLITN